MKVTTRNASFQQWQALLTNRTKRQRAGEFLVQGVRPITLAVEHGWTVRALLYPDRRALSGWARDMLDRGRRDARWRWPRSCSRELGGKADEPPELLAVVGAAAGPLDRIPVGPRAARRGLRPADHARATSAR